MRLAFAVPLCAFYVGCSDARSSVDSPSDDNRGGTSALVSMGGSRGGDSNSALGGAEQGGAARGGASQGGASIALTAGTSSAAGGEPHESGGSTFAGESGVGGVGGTATVSGSGASASNAGSGQGGQRTGGAGGAGGQSSAAGTSPSGAAAGAAGQSGSNGVPLAFPGAQGFGKNATGGRDGSVYHVTNLDDSGAGSFRDAVSASGRIVVFDVGGYVTLRTAVSVKSNITIAGQTAPGGGIGFRGGEISFANSSNLILRFVRIRPGSETESTEDDALSLYRAKNVIIDHSSFEFAPWNDIDGVSDDWQNHPVTDITFQDSVIADPTGQQFGAHTESVSSQWAWYRNIFANSHNRNPLAKVNTVFVNNVLYNDSAGYTTHTSTSFKHDIVNNYFIFGPASTGTDNQWYQVDKNQSIYAAGNLKDTNLDGTLNGAETTPYWYQGTGAVLTGAWSSETGAQTPLDPVSAVRVAMSNAGPFPRDELDALVVSQVATFGKGTTGLGAGTTGPNGSLYTSQEQTGLANSGYGSISGGAHPPDSDEDGMSDAWELATGSDPHADDAMGRAPDGYALIEHYLNWLAEPHASTAAGAPVDIDLAAYTAGFSPVAPIYTLAAAQNGTVALAADHHTATFTPASAFHGVGTFTFTVHGSDGSAYTASVSILITP